MCNEDLWDTEAAENYDTPGAGMFSPEVLDHQAQVSRSPHRYIWPAELDLMAQLAGFELESRHADWVGSEFTSESRSHVSVYRIPVEL
jgi:hypothetical protein